MNSISKRVGRVRKVFFSLQPSSLILIFLLACGEEARPTAGGQLAPSVAPASGRSAIYTLPVEATFAPTVIPTVTPVPATPVPPTATPRPKVGPAVAGELPAPLEARKLNLTVGMLQKLQKRLGGRYASVDLNTLSVAAYASPEMPADLFDYYRAALKDKGWTESRAYDNRFGVYFVKGAQVAAVGIVGVPDSLTLGFLAGFVPEVRGQVQAGESLLVLGQGPAKTFEVLKKGP